MQFQLGARLLCSNLRRTSRSLLCSPSPSPSSPPSLPPPSPASDLSGSCSDCTQCTVVGEGTMKYQLLRLFSCFQSQCEKRAFSQGVQKKRFDQKVLIWLLSSPKALSDFNVLVSINYGIMRTHILPLRSVQCREFIYRKFLLF